MNIKEVVYSDHDPCVDLYCSIYYKEVILGARRFSPTNGVALDCLTHRLGLWPSDRELGELLTLMLMSPQSLGPHDARCPWSLSSASSLEDFGSAFWPFNVWTKKDIAFPLIVGAPISEHYTDTFSRKPINKQGSPEFVGAEVISFIKEVIAELCKAGLKKWNWSGHRGPVSG